MPSVAPAANLPVKSVLIATDFSEASRKPLCHALGITRCYGQNSTWRTSFTRRSGRGGVQRRGTFGK